ncbi:MAG: hypothetical protein ABJC09_16030 [Terriglobia bacterium]
MTHHHLAIVSLLGSCFDVLGALYLAYDILGGNHGPLRALTRAVTYGVIFGSGYGVVLGLPFGIASGITHGFTLALEFGRATQGLAPFSLRYEALFSAIRGAGFAVGAYYIYGPRFGITFGLLATAGQIVAYSLGSRPALAYSPALRPRLGRPQLIAIGGRTVGYAIAGYISAGFAGHEMHAVMFGEEAGLAIGLVTAAANVLTPYVEWAAETIPDRRMGVAGVILILIGFGLQSVQYWLALFDVPLT